MTLGISSFLYKGNSNFYRFGGTLGHSKNKTKACAKNFFKVFFRTISAWIKKT